MTLNGCAIILSAVAWWCNGSTGVFGTLSRGSNPCRAAIILAKRLILSKLLIINLIYCGGGGRSNGLKVGGGGGGGGRRLILSSSSLFDCGGSPKTSPSGTVGAFIVELFSVSFGKDSNGFVEGGGGGGN